MIRPLTNPRTVLSLSALTLLITGAVLYAGPLNPPAGPVASTAKTLAEVEPRIAINSTNTPGDPVSLFKITQRGSYYLTGNITGVVGRHGIEIAASGVTIDLNGFDLVGVPAMGAFDGITVTVNSLDSIAVVNGTIRNWGDDGIDFVATPAANCRIDGVLVSGNGGTGILAGPGSTVSNCSAQLNTGSGFAVGEGSTISACSARSNTANGFFIGSACTILGSTAQSNTLSGFNIFGIGCTVTNCSATLNSGNGIAATGGSSTVAGCTAHSNTNDGIACGSSCVIRGNTCATNGAGFPGGAGIHATGVDNLIEANNCTGNGRGIDVDGTGNIIVRNTCSGNTLNWTIAVGNSFGAIVIAGTNGLAINGNGPVASTLVSTDPHANFSY